MVAQIRKRLAGEPIEDRLLSLFDPDARPIRKRTLGTTTELGSGEQLAEVTPTRKPGARGCIVAPASAPGNPGENEPLATTVQELQQLALRPREELAPLAPKRTFIAGRASPGSRRTQRRLARYPVGAEGRSLHLQRRHRLRRSRLQGGEGERSCTGWALFSGNVEPYGRYA